MAWNSDLPIGSLSFFKAAVQDLFKADQILGDKHIQRCSLLQSNQSTEENPTDFVLYSDRISTMWPSYVLDERCRIRPGPETPVVNFVLLKALLLSTDLASNSELDRISDENLRFLDGTDISGQ